MNLLDMRSVLMVYMISNAICVGVMTSLWIQNNSRTPGLKHWVWGLILLLAAIPLLALRGIVLDFFSIVIGNFLLLLGIQVILIGLERFAGKEGSHLHNWLMLGLFILIQVYFTFYQPLILVRKINFSIGLMVISFQCAWLLLKRVDVSMRAYTRTTGLIFLGYSLFSLVRIILDLSIPQSENLLLSSPLDGLVILIYQMLTIIITFSLFLLVNRRLYLEFERDIAHRKIVEGALAASEEKFSKAFKNHPDAIVLSLMKDGRIIEVNEGFFNITGFTRPEVMGKTTIELDLWKRKNDRAVFLKELLKNGRIREYEAVFRKKSGELLTGSVSGEVIQINGMKSLISVIRDITNWKKTEEELRLDGQMMASITDGIFLHTLSDDTIVFANPQFERLFGYDRNELIGQNVSILNAGDDRQAQKLAREIQTALGRHGGWNGEILNRRKDGSHFWSHVSASVFEHKTFGKVAVSVHQDITERKDAEEKIKANDERLQALTDILHHKSDSTQDFLDHALEQALAMTKSQLGYIYLYNEEKREFTLNTWSREVMKECLIQDPQIKYQLEKMGIWGEAVRQRKPIVLNDYLAAHPLKKGYPEGHAPLKNFMTIPVINNDRIVAVIGMANKPIDYNDTDVLQLMLLMSSVWNIVEQRQTEKALHDSEAELKALFASMQDVVITFDHEGRYLKVATTGSQLLINPPEELLGKSIYEVFPRDIADRWVSHIQTVIEAQTTKHIEYPLIVAGREIWFDAAVSPLDRETVIWVARDITKRKIMEEKSYFIGTHDQLTGTFNRNYFEEELKRLERSRRYPISILMLDLDNLKEVNDSRGHAAGDEVLQRTAKVFRDSLRSEDVFARIGGDEFAAILPSTDEAAAELVQRRLQENIEKANKDQPIKLFVSSGKATCLQDCSLTEALKDADVQMYRNKRLKQDKVNPSGNQV